MNNETCALAAGTFNPPPSPVRLTRVFTWGLLGLSLLFVGRGGAFGAPTEVVSTLNDVATPGKQTLREALSAVSPGGSVEFEASLFAGGTPGVIVLQSPLQISKSVTVVGPGSATPGAPSLLRLEGSGQRRILEIAPPGGSITVVISGIRFQNGRHTVAGGPNSGGGALVVAPGADATFQDCQFVDSGADDSTDATGGAILNRGTLTLDQCVVSQAGGSAAALRGGGIGNLGTLRIFRSLLVGNGAADQGGAIYSAGGTVQVESSTFSGNRAALGGAIALSGSTSLSLLASTVADNHATSSAGGLRAAGAGASAGLAGSLFARNTAGPGAGSPSDLGTAAGGSIVSANYNLIPAPGTALAATGAGDLIGADPLLGPLADNGGPTASHAPAAGSPAIDRGNPAFTSSLSTDQRGFTRVWSATAPSRVDIGAVEFVQLLVAPSPLSAAATGALTPVTVNASLQLPVPQTVPVSWTVGAGAPSVQTVVVPQANTPVPLSFVASLPVGTTSVTIAVPSSVGALSATVVVTVVPTGLPVITVPGDIIAEATSAAGAIVSFPLPVATDSEGPVVVTTTPPSGSTFPLGKTVVAIQATDTDNNTTSASFSVTVRDTTPPTIQAPGTVFAEATSLAGAAVAFNVTATDFFTPVSVTASPVSGSFFPFGSSLVNVLARDANNNLAAGSFNVTVRDTTPPTLSPVADLIVDATDDQGAIVTFPLPVAADLFGPVAVQAVPAPGSRFPFGSTPVTVTATDANGNRAETQFRVRVRDTTPPELTVPANIVTEASGAFGATVTFAASASDPSGVTVSYSHPPGSLFPLGVTTVTVTATDGSGNTTTKTFTVTVRDSFGVALTNVVWTSAMSLDPLFRPDAGGETRTASVEQSIARPGEARWYSFTVYPGSRITAAITRLAANYDLVLYSDIQKAYNDLVGLAGGSDSDRLLALLGAEFAPEAYSPEAYSPEAYSPEAYSPEAYSPEAYSPEAYSPEAYSPEAYSPEAYSPEAYSPEAYSPEAYSPEAYSPEAYSPEAYSSAQQRSVVAFSASQGTVGETIRMNTYTRSGTFYLRVRGRNGAASPSPFVVSVTLAEGACRDVTDLKASTPEPERPVIGGSPTSLILWHRDQIAGTSREKDALAASLERFQYAVKAHVVELGAYPRIRALAAQSAQRPSCLAAKQFLAEAIRDIILLHRDVAPSIRDVTLIGGDTSIPFFRTDDQALLASESKYFPPVREDTSSEAALRFAQVLTQDRYGSSSRVVLATGPYDLPEIPVGRLVETAAEVTAYLDRYAPLFTGPAKGVITPRSAFVAGYDFLADAAEAMVADFRAGLGSEASVSQLISPISDPPSRGWTAAQLRTAFLGRRSDISYLAAHFSTARLLAADYATRLEAPEVAASDLDLEYALVLSPGCHSGYNTVDAHAVPGLTRQPDWAQAFARKRALWIAGTGYQYGDTDFIEYTERLLLEFSRSLRRGSGPVSLGQALVEAKNRYLADTPVMRGIHEKSLVQVTLYGLPMVKFNLPGERLAASGSASAVASVVPVPSPTSANLRLYRGDLAVAPELTQEFRQLDVVGSQATVTASFFRGPDGVVTLPGEPARPRVALEVGRPEGLLRGVGFRGGRYRDLPGFVPFTGAPATETRGVHGAFATPVFFPVVPWALNQIGRIAVADGGSELNVFPTQFISDAGGVTTGTLRRFDDMQFSLFYSPLSDSSALANPPAINIVESAVGTSAVTFRIEVAASASVGVAEVWVTHTLVPHPGAPTAGEGFPIYGVWRSVSLTAPVGGAGTGVWTGSLPLAPGTDPTKVRFVVQAVNGVGGVALNSNFGTFFTAGTSSTESPVANLSASRIEFVGTAPAAGSYRESLPVQARLTAAAGTPLAGRVVRFRVGPVVRSATTNAAGVAATTLVLDTRPGDYTLEASFAGDGEFGTTESRRSFSLGKAATELTLQPVGQTLVATLSAVDGTPLKERTIVFVIQRGTTRSSISEITDGAGRVTLPLGDGDLQVLATFGQSATLADGSTVILSDPLYAGTTRSGGFTLSDASLRFVNRLVWLQYADPAAPGASRDNAGLSSVFLQGSLVGPAQGFGPSAVLSASGTDSVRVTLKADLSGRTIASGSFVLRVVGQGGTVWIGEADLDGARAELLMTWDQSAGTAAYSLRLLPSPRTGPLFGDVPAVLAIEISLGTARTERPIGGKSTTGDAANPWSSEGSNFRMKL